MSWISKLKMVVDNSDKLKEAVGKSKQALGENAGKINSVIDSVTQTADTRTGGKYSEKIDKLKDTAKDSVSHLATDEKPGEATTPAAAGADAPPAPLHFPTAHVEPTETTAPQFDPPDAEVVED
jgi:hypothetical protein